MHHSDCRHELDNVVPLRGSQGRPTRSPRGEDQARREAVVSAEIVRILKDMLISWRTHSSSERKP